jgi:hypothetical protein
LKLCEAAIVNRWQKKTFLAKLIESAEPPPFISPLLINCLHDYDFRTPERSGNFEKSPLGKTRGHQGGWSSKMFIHAVKISFLRKPCYFHTSNFVFFHVKKNSEKYLRSFIYITIYFNCNMVSICGERSALASGLRNWLKLGNLISRGFPVTALKERC